jgi:DNA modification methylase
VALLREAMCSVKNEGNLKGEVLLVFARLHNMTKRLESGDCLDLIPTLPNRSIRLFLFSPPYADQMRGVYPGWSEDMYPERLVSVMDAIHPKLTADGSVLIVIRSHIKKGVMSPYVLRSRLAVLNSGWKEPGYLYWHKPDGSALGCGNLRPRQVLEEILWYSKTHKPHIDLYADGVITDQKGPTHHVSERRKKQLYKTGVARISNLFEARVSQNDKVNHPCPYPVALCRKIIRTFTNKGDTVCDPFCGSASTLVAAKQLGRGYIGFDVVPEYIDDAILRLANPADLPIQFVPNLGTPKARKLYIQNLGSP